MKILIINTYHYLRGGDCRHAFGLAELLKDKGHDVHFFGMKGENNLTCPEEEFFVSEIDYRNAITAKNLPAALRVVWRSIYSFEAKKNIATLLNAIKPDIAHLHSIRHHLTKSILPELAKRNIPIIWTLHDYKEICPNTSFYDGRTICENCKGKKYSNVIWNRCKKGSLAASLVTYLEAKINDWLDFDKHVDLYIAPSKFLRNKFIEYGYASHKVIYLPNFMDIDGFIPYYNHENYLLFIGRLEKEKGIVTMIKGFAKTKSNSHSLSLKIAGTGSMEKELRNFVKEMRLSNVEFPGFKQGKDLEELTKRAKAIIMPSEWYENCPFAGLEAMAYGKPIIASRIGGIPEQVEDGVTGFLFEPFNVDQLAERMQVLGTMPDKRIEEMGRKARKKVEKVNDPQQYHGAIIEIYNELISLKK